MCYLVPRGVAVLRAGLALGWSWSFTVCQPGLGIAPRLRLGGLGNEQAGRRRIRRSRRRKKVKKKHWERSEEEGRGGVGKRASSRTQHSAVYWAGGDEYKHRVKLWREKF